MGIEFGTFIYFFNANQKMDVRSLKKPGQEMRLQLETDQHRKWAVLKYWKENSIR